MPLTEERRSQLDGIVNQMVQNKESDDAINFVVNDFKSKYEGQTQPPPPSQAQGPTGIGRIPLAIAQGANTGIAGLAGFPVDIMNKIMGLALPISQTPFMGSQWIKQNVMPSPVIQPQGLVENIATATGEQIPALLPGVGLASRGLPLGKTLLDAARMMFGGGMGGGIARTAFPDNVYADMAGQLMGSLGGAATIKPAQTATQLEQKTGQIIDKGISKGVKPSVSGKGEFGQMELYQQRAQDAVKTIISNKNNLQLTDETGQIVSKLPENLREFSQAIQQTKRSVFAQYDAMAGKAQTVGVKVDLQPIANELKVISSDPVLKSISPNVANYASERARLLQSNAPSQPLSGMVGNAPPPPPTWTATQTQDAIAHLNNSLEAFYKNPSYENASKAAIDAMVANRLRKNLDTAIEGVSGKGYQELKNKYGSLSAIEKDVAHRAVVDARKNIKGFFDLTDIFSGAEVVRGIVGMNPSAVAAGVAANRIKAIWKHMVDPNNIVKGMFSNAEKTFNSSPSKTSRDILVGSELVKQMEE